MTDLINVLYRTIGKSMLFSYELSDSYTKEFILREEMINSFIIFDLEKLNAYDIQYNLEYYRR